MSELEQVSVQYGDEKMSLVGSNAQPFGAPQPPNQPHAISVSLPTWRSVTATMAGESWALNQLQTCYPRFTIHRYVQALHAAIFERLQHPEHTICRVFPSAEAAERLVATLMEADVNMPVHTVRFCLSHESVSELAKWAAFSVVLFHESLAARAIEFWEWFGDGISSRHAEFCVSQFPYMDSYSEVTRYRSTRTRSPDLSATSLPSWINDPMRDKEEIKSRLASSLTSVRTNSAPKGNKDVFLYLTGMNAISVLSRALARTSQESGVVVYGWPYSGTPHCVKNCGFSQYIMYGRGSVKDLDSLESLLVSGTRITLLLCEVPSNPQLSTPDLHRIRALADQYGFVVGCDNTLGTPVNLDILPYVDIIITSLTKIFSGAGNVMGGSLTLNPNSDHYTMLQFLLGTTYEDLYFPLDAAVMAHNSTDFEQRIHKCNKTALQIATLLRSHPSVESVNYPTMVPTAPLYERYRRPGGGYGFLLSMVFREPDSAVLFYDTLDVWKGPTVGTNSSIAIPYSALAHAREQDWAASHGVPKHIVRLSVGLEEYDNLAERVCRALQEVERREKMV